MVTNMRLTTVRFYITLYTIKILANLNPSFGMSTKERRACAATEERPLRKIFQDRRRRGEFHQLIADLRLHDNEYFFKYFSMSPTKYEELLRLIAPSITKDQTKLADCIGPSERLLCYYYTLSLYWGLLRYNFC